MMKILKPIKTGLNETNLIQVERQEWKIDKELESGGYMKKPFPIVLLFVNMVSSAEEYYDYGMAEGIPICGEFPPESIEADILAKIIVFSKDREQLIKKIY
jgi:hypothetical protein